jgi:hypothetical protein
LPNCANTTVGAKTPLHFIECRLKGANTVVHDRFIDFFVGILYYK